LIVKTRPDDLEKISVIRDLIATHVNVDRILEQLRP
jgi:BioD-like phosphotransacetylase family protein